MGIEDSYKSLVKNHETLNEYTCHTIMTMVDFLSWDRAGDTFRTKINGIGLSLCSTPNGARVITDDGKTDIVSKELNSVYDYLDSKITA